MRDPELAVAERRAAGKRVGLLRGASLGMELTTALAGCALVTQSPPQVDVASVALTEIGPFSQSFLVTLCVMNPNRTQIAFERVGFTIA